MKHYDPTISLNEKKIIVLMVIIIAFLIGYFTGYFGRNKYDINEDGKVTDADYVEVKKYIFR